LAWGDAVPIPTRSARIRNWFVPVEAKSAFSLSAQTKLPSCTALALRPAARLKRPAAMFPKPPGTVA
jgi:hypothetical protein